ncbi:MAG: adenosine deaminase [Alphaproteobacteria bacterium]
MTDTYLTYFAKNLPKAELHLHIEGSLEPELMFKLAQRNGIQPGSAEFPFKTVDEVRAAYSFSNLQDFLDIYYQGANVLRTEQDFYDLAAAYFERAHEDNVRHTEIFFDPQTHTDRGVPYSEVIGGLSRAAKDAEDRFGMSVFLVHSFLRHLPEDQAFASLKMAEPYLKDAKYKIIGVGLDSSEVGHPPEKFARVFARAEALGLKLMAHAGEEGPPEYIHQALNILKVARIDHGNRSLEDAPLTRRLAAEGMTLTVCPLSNLKLCVVDDMKKHPIPTMLKEGLKATINSDDPAYFGGYVADNYTALTDAGIIGREDCIALARNSITGSFLPDDRKNTILAQIDDYAARTTAPAAGASCANTVKPA